MASASEEKNVSRNQDGETGQASYSADGQKLLYVAWNRSNHSQPQVYERHLESGTERRLTYQNGSTFAPRYHPTEAMIVYASTTDELKENNPLLYPDSLPPALPKDYQQPTEIYTHAINGLEITRLTERHGFDGQARFTGDGKQLIWTRVVKNRTQIILMNLKTRAQQVLYNLGVNPTHYVLSTDRKTFSWIEWDKAFQNAKIKIKVQKKPVTEINGEHQVTKTDLEMSADARYLTWSQLNAIGANYEIWIYDIENQCPYMMVGADEADRRYPTFSPDMKTLTYTMIKGERSSIVNLPFAPPSGPCSKGD